jgi:hypothetical protein
MSDGSEEVRRLKHRTTAQADRYCFHIRLDGSRACVPGLLLPEIPAAGSVSFQWRILRLHRPLNRQLLRPEIPAGLDGHKGVAELRMG